MTTVAVAITGMLQGIPIPMALEYSTADPFAVTLHTDLEDDAKDWRFARSLLVKATNGMVNEDTPATDILIRRAATFGAQIEIVLMPYGKAPASILFPRNEVQEFLRTAQTLKPLAEESSGIDWAEAETILGLEPGTLTDEPRT